jgi:cytochrome c
MKATVSGARSVLSSLVTGLILIGGAVLFPGLNKAVGEPAPVPDARAGQMLFEKRCAGCHGLDNAKEGPPLRTVYGRKAGSVGGFEYSDALKNSHVVWDEAALNQWLTSTESLVHDNDMEFAVPKPDERAEIIQYLKESSGK